MSARMHVHACANVRHCLCMHLHNLLEIFIFVGEHFVKETVLGVRTGKSQHGHGGVLQCIA
jgi:hypothetical protein